MPPFFPVRKHLGKMDAPAPSSTQKCQSVDCCHILSVSVLFRLYILPRPLQSLFSLSENREMAEVLGIAGGVSYIAPMIPRFFARLFHAVERVALAGCSEQTRRKWAMKRMLFGGGEDVRRIRWLPEIAMEFRDVPKEDIDAALDGLDEISKRTFWTFLSRAFFPTMKNTPGIFDRTPRHFFIGSGLASEAECRKWDELLQAEISLKKKYLAHPVVSDCLYTFTLRHGLPLLPDAALSYMRGKVFVDGGAFVGDSSLVFLDYDPGEIWAFEPGPNSQRFFGETMQRNQVPMERIKLIPKGLSDKIENIRFEDTADGDSAFTEQGMVVAQLTPLDALTADVEVGFIKTDLEGMGLAMLRGSEETIRRDRPVLSLSIYHNKEEMLGTYAFLKSLKPGYRYRIVQLAPPWEWHELCLLAWPEEFGELQSGGTADTWTNMP